MSFIWPYMLLCLVVVPLLVVMYVRIQQRRRRMVASYGSFGRLQQQGGRPIGKRRHIPPVLFLMGLTIAIVALARPEAQVSLPRLEGTVVLAFDVSGSMNATDMQPNRMEAAKAAARSFIEKMPETVQVGVVAFSESGLNVQRPTNDQGALLAAINRLTVARGTSLATGIVASLGVIAALDEDNVRGYYTSRVNPNDPIPTPEPVPKGSNKSVSIVLLSDGENTVAPDPMEAAQAAADRGVRVHTIGIGSPQGVTLKVEGFTVHTQLDEATLQQIAEMTDGTYRNAQNEEELRKIYDDLDKQLVITPQKTEITSLVAGASLLVLLIGGALSMFWLSRLP